MCKDCGNCSKEHTFTIDTSVDKIEESVII
jgi:hypothetical protein